MRKIYLTVLCLSVACLTAIEAYAGDIDYLEYQNRVDLFTELAVSVKSCERMGMEINWEGVNKISDQLIANAQRNGIDVDTFAEPLIVNSLREKTKNEDSLLKYYKENLDKMDEYTEYWSKRCHKLATNELTKQYVQFRE